MNYLSAHILGKVLDNVEDIDGWNLSFGDASLVIYNPIEIFTNGTLCEHPNLTIIKGATVKEILETELEVKLIFNENRCVRVDLRPESYSGPEAMVLHIANNGFVVW